MRKDTRKKMILTITRFAMFLAIETIICFVPFLGAIKIGPVAATLAMIPVIIAGCLFGPLFGGSLGFFAGLFSFIWWTFIEKGNPTAMLFTPWNDFNGVYQTSYWTLVICFVPRILTGVVSAYVEKGFSKIIHKKLFSCAISSIIGSLTNTFLVLFGTYFLWGKDYALLCGMDYQVLLITILTLVATNGLFEAAVSSIIGGTVCQAITSINNKA